MTSLVILDKDVNELREIGLKIQEDGLRPDLPDEHKLRHIWRCWQRSESSLHSALEDVESLRRQHGEEMIEVENYVAHIRQLSEEREALTLEFEAENEQLKDEIEELKLEKESGMFISNTVSKLLDDKGYSCFSNIPIKEQIINLAEAEKISREKVKELQSENLRLKVEGDTVSSKMLEIVEAERAEMDMSMAKMKENLKTSRQEDRVIFEQEITTIKEEKANLQNQVNESETRIKSLVAEVTHLAKSLEEEKQRHRKGIEEIERTLGAKLEKELNERKLAQEEEFLKKTSRQQTLQIEVDSLREQLTVVIEEKKTLKEMINQLEEDLWTEKLNWESIFEESEAQLQKVKDVLSMNEKELASAKSRESQLQQANSDLEDLVSNLNNDLAEAKRREGDRTLQEKSSTEKLNAKVNEQARENRSLNLKIRSLEDTLNQNEALVGSLQDKLLEKDETMKQAIKEANKNEIDSRNELSALRKKITSVETMLETEKQQTKLSADKYEEAITILHNQEKDAQNKLIASLDETKSLREQVKQLQHSLADLQQKIEQDTVQYAHQDQKMTEEVKVLGKDKEDLMQQIESLKESQRKKEEEILTFEGKLKEVNHEKATLEAALLTQKQKMEEITNKLVIHEQEAVKQQLASNTIKNENSELTTKLNTTMKDLSSARSQVANLLREFHEATNEHTSKESSFIADQAVLQRAIEELKFNTEKERQEANDQRVKINKDLNKIKEENFDLKTSNKELEKEIQDYQAEVATLTQINGELRERFGDREKIKQSLEVKVEELQSQMDSAEKRIKDYDSRTSLADAARQMMEKDLETKRQSFKELEATLKSKQMDYNTLEAERDALQQRNDFCERQISSLNGEVDTLRNELHKMTVSLEESLHFEANLRAKSQEVDILRKNLEEKSKSGLILNETIKELESQIDVLEEDRAKQAEKYSQINLVLAAKEESVALMKKQQKQTSKQHNNSENHARSLTGRLEELQGENAKLKVELVRSQKLCEELKRKYDEKKIRAFTKLQALSEKYTRERKSFEMLVSQLQSNLDISRDRLEKEGKWRTETDQTQKRLLDERSLLLAKITSLEEEVRDGSREIRQLRTRQESLEEEKYELEEKLQMSLREKQNLECCLREVIEKEMFGSSPHRRNHSPDSRVVADAYLHALKPGAGLGRRPSPGPGESNPIRRGPDGRVANQFGFGKSTASSGVVSPVEDCR